MYQIIWHIYIYTYFIYLYEDRSRTYFVNLVINIKLLLSMLFTKEFRSSSPFCKVFFSLHPMHMAHKRDKKTEPKRIFYCHRCIFSNLFWWNKINLGIKCLFFFFFFVSLQVNFCVFSTWLVKPTNQIKYLSFYFVCSKKMKNGTLSTRYWTNKIQFILYIASIMFDNKYTTHAVYVVWILFKLMRAQIKYK